ncbi:hypothetical protein yc1106_07090 [Curvularia clavata]|uniref:Uncharacterized protein n=1 Tax=Curvularia clavata TaxID=95742 RepID=A0A9Q8ZCT1_CURCL|nr:hypothetical protein yc1106_07090 [Curvularia clavata]
MAVLAAILPVVSRSSALALELFKTAAACPEAAKELVEVANKINGFASILKQVGTIIKEDDRLPSPEILFKAVLQGSWSHDIRASGEAVGKHLHNVYRECDIKERKRLFRKGFQGEKGKLHLPVAFDALDDVIEQSQNVMSSFESATSTGEAQNNGRRDSARSVESNQPQLDASITARLTYLMAHLEALSTTLSVLLQTLYTAQSVMWSRDGRVEISWGDLTDNVNRLRPTVSPQQAAKVVDNEKTQLETLIIQQQLSILSARKIFEQSPWSDARLITEEDYSQSLVLPERGKSPKPSNLHPYRHQELSTLETLEEIEANRLSSICRISRPHAEYLLDRWTSLPQFERRLQEEELEQRKQRQQGQQATVESDSEEEERQRAKVTRDGAQRSSETGTQPLFTENNLPSPELEKHFGPPAPPTPADTPHTSHASLSSTSPRTSIGSLPVEAAAAVEAKEEDAELDLEIPWKLCTRKYYWRFVDAKQVGSNTDQAPSTAFLERSSWTEIMASWVCKEAIQEARLPFTQVQKEKKDSRRTRFETCFCIERPLQFDQVKRLVERTVEIYRKNAPPTPPSEPKPRTSSFHRQPPPPSSSAQKGKPVDRDRTPIARNTHPPLHRASSSMNFPPPPPPPPSGPPSLDRSMSMPGPALVPPKPQPNNIPRSPNLQIPIPPHQQYSQHHPTQFQAPRLPMHSPQTNGYPSQPTNTGVPPYYPQSPAQNVPHPYSATAPPMSPRAPHLHASNSAYNMNYNYNNSSSSSHPMQASPLRTSYLSNPPPSYPGSLSSTSNRRYDDDLTTSDSESERPRRSRRERERSRARYTDRYGDNGKYGKKSNHVGRKAAGTLLGVGGLTALLDGLSGL